jgi:predicted nucleotidyltransferase
MRLDVDHEALESFCRENRIRRLALFGSVLREDFGPQSDVDVLVEFEPGTRMGLMGLTRVELELTAMLGRKVDLNTPKGLHHRFRDRVLAEAEVLYAA